MRHLTVLGAAPEIRRVAIPTRSWRAKDLAQEGITTARDIVEAVRMGATHCIIATDTRRHVEDALAALDCGIDVLVEKPLACNAAEALSLVSAGRNGRPRAFVGCVMRFSESIGIFRDLLVRLGRLHSVRVECQSYLPEWRPTRPYKDSYSARGAEGGVLRDLIHEIDYAGWLFGWPHALQASVRNLGRLGVESEEAAELFWELEDGCAVSLCLDYLSRPYRRQMRAMGEHGTLLWDGRENVVTLTFSTGEEKNIDSLQTRDQMLLTEDLAFIDAGRRESDPRLVTARDGLRALAVCDAARRAAISKREEKVEYC